MLKHLLVIYSAFLTSYSQGGMTSHSACKKTSLLDVLQCAPFFTTDQITYSWSCNIVIPEFLKTRF